MPGRHTYKKKLEKKLRDGKMTALGTVVTCCLLLATA